MLTLKNATLVHLDPPLVVPGATIDIDGTIISSVSRAGAETPRRVDGTSKVLDLQGKIVMPGLVCSHNHFYSGLARGILATIPPSTDFVSNLMNLWWRLDRALDAESLASSGMICCLEAIKNGCTVSSWNALGTSLTWPLHIASGIVPNIILLLNPINTNHTNTKTDKSDSTSNTP